MEGHRKVVLDKLFNTELGEQEKTLIGLSTILRFHSADAFIQSDVQLRADTTQLSKHGLVSMLMIL